MSDKMRPISFEKLLIWIEKELKQKGSIFGVHQSKFYKNKSGKSIEVFGEKLASPLGPAAGPNTQLTQNIVSAYLTGSRFIELKTVQVIDGEDLPVSKPCIRAQDECYNVEWSTELKVSDAFDEYIKAWFLLHILMKELNLSRQRDFVFNMSVGYDLKGIKSPKVNKYIEGMRNASNTKIWDECKKTITSHMDLFTNFTQKDLEQISPVICSSITVSTLHGCPPDEIEKICNYLLQEKKLNIFIKMNPTLLGEKFVRNTLNIMGYDYIALNGEHFKNDLQYDDAVAMLQRLKNVAKVLNLEIGVKLTNTLPVKVENGELPGEEMYMSGRSLFPLTISLAGKLAKEFEGNLQISYSGGADFFNVDKILDTGIQPVTFATTILKPGGYERITQMARKVEKKLKGAFSGIDTDMLSKLAVDALKDEHYLKDSRTVESRKLSVELPTYDCAVSPCSIGCPVNQQIPEYVSLVGKKKYDEAFSIIAKDNASPAITATICNHNCQFKCTRLDYDSSVLIRDMKKVAVLNAEKKYIENIKPADIKSNKKVIIIGAGPAGLSTALFLRRNGVDVTVIDKKEKPYGVVRYVIPDFRIPLKMIEQDFALVKKQGVKFKFGINENFNIDELKEKYDYIILAIGAWKPGKINLKEGSQKAVGAIAFLERYKAEKENIDLGKKVCIIGGGNVAMDAARAAKRVAGVEDVSIVYRRTKEYMPADSEELKLAVSDGIVFKELLAPTAIKDNKLVCEKMKLGEKDASGRRNPVSTGKEVVLEADTIIVAVGEKVDSDLLRKNKIGLNDKNLPKVNKACETNISNVYIVGDAKGGSATIVKAIADGKTVAKDILSKEGLNNDFDKKVIPIDEEQIYSRKGTLRDPGSCEEEYERCLSCSNICELCVDVCPNRANVVINIENGFASSHQIIHLDGMCNECGNCGIFCPYKGNPYRDKVTVFWNENDFENSENKGFYVVDMKKGICRVRREDGKVVMYTVGEKDIISKEMEYIIKSCINEYSYML